MSLSHSCDACEGAGSWVECLKHPGAACPCNGIEVRCGECKGIGAYLCDDADCELCVTMEEAVTAAEAMHER